MNSLNGIIIIDKEKEWTSNDIVQKIKNLVHEKTGHTGTLDPLATGVLPILVGKGTLLSKYLINHDKEYLATIKLGQKTNTGDSEGEIIEQKEVTKKMLQKDIINQILETLKGKQNQVPPIYSAIKVNGKKLYEYARKGKQVEIKSREIEIYQIELISILLEKQEIQYKVSCSKGTYIRKLSEDIAEKLGTVGFTKELRRTKVGEFKLDKARQISEILKNEELLKENLITIEQFFEKKEKIKLNQKQCKMFLNGVNLKILLKDGIYRIYDENLEFIGIGVIKENCLKRDICI